MARQTKPQFVNVGGIRIRADKTLAQLEAQRHRIGEGWRTSHLSNSRYTVMNAADKVGMQAFADGFGTNDYNRVKVGDLYGEKAEKWRKDINNWMDAGGGFKGLSRPEHPANIAAKGNSVH